MKDFILTIAIFIIFVLMFLSAYLYAIKEYAEAIITFLIMLMALPFAIEEDIRPNG